MFSLSREETMIGRGNDNDLVLDHGGVSRHHLRLLYQDDVQGGAFQITDLQSSNGTRLDGISLTSQVPTALLPSQMIEIGDFLLILEEASENHPFVTKGKSPFLIRYRFDRSEWQSFPINEGDTILGRDPECDLMLNDSDVSRQHVRVRIDDRRIWLVDLDSTNGTKVNGVLLAPQKDHPLQLKQIFVIGNFKLQIDERSRYDNLPSYLTKRFSRKDISQNDSLQTIIDKEEYSLPSVPVRTMNLMAQERVTIGRAVENDVVLNHPLVNRYHAVIERIGTRFRIQDLGSTTGVYVNEKRIERETFLKDWDHIQVGSFVFVLSGDDLQHQVVPGLKLEAKNINQQVSRSIKLFQDINLVIKANEFVALLGISGSGKTTLLNALSGYWPASHGSVLINDIDLYKHYDLFRNEIGYVPQEDIVHAVLTPDSALNYAAKLRLPSDITRQERKTIVAKVLEELDLSEHRKVPIPRLSGEQRKRVSIGCELLIRPRLLYLDEPTNGLDPGNEYEMMRLLRCLADQGRTILLITQTTNNVMLCDKVIFLTQDGSLAFFGGPEYALDYFDQFRTDHERLEKDMAFADIYRILNDDARGTSSEWTERYLTSRIYYQVFGIEPTLAEMGETQVPDPAPIAEQVRGSAQQIAGFRQFLILSARNLKILVHDRISLVLMLMLAPILGMIDLLWGPDLYDPVNGDAGRIIILWFLGTFVAVLVGALSSIREIVKEVDIYKRERTVNLKIMPYVLSKVWLGIVLGLYQAGVLLALRHFFVDLKLSAPTAFFGVYITFFLGITTGTLIGLLVSAIAPNQNAAMRLLIAVLVPLFLFAGALLPLDFIPGGQQISVLMPTRWTFESFVRITELGEELIQDPCWNGFNKKDRLLLSTEAKEKCPCLGSSIFTDCATFPGILSSDFYDETALIYLEGAKPMAPVQPTAIPFPTAISSPTPLATPTLLPSLTPYPTPRILKGFLSYMDKIREQDKEYQILVADQFEQYRLDSISQREIYSNLRTTQGIEYAVLSEAQRNEYAAAMQIYGDERSAWQGGRDRAIISAEATLGSLFDNFQQTLEGSVIGRWTIVFLIQIGLFLLILVAQKRKDLVWHRPTK